MISRYTWRDFELKEPSTIENNVLEQLENSRYPIFLPLKQPLLALFRNICISGDPFRISETDANRKGFLLDAREWKESRLCVTAPFPEFLSFYDSPMRDASVSPQYLDDFASKFSS